MKSNFQIIILVVFAVFLVFGILVFAGIIPIGSSAKDKVAGNVVMWGTLPASLLQPYIESVQKNNKGLTVLYVQKNPLTFDTELVEALAAARGPDVFFLKSDEVLKNADRVLTIPYENYPQKTFYAQFIDESGIFLNQNGMIAFPLLIDPMVMYYNRDILSSSFLLEPPKYWDEFITFTGKVTKTSESGEIIQSGAALGAYRNVNHAKDVLSLLILQAGSPIVLQSPVGYVSTLRDPVKGALIPPAESALRFYTTFSDPLQESYSWNSSRPNSFDEFTAGNLGVYFGYASELSAIRAANPNLNFDVAMMPQTRTQKNVLTTARMTGLAISKLSQNVPAAFLVASVFSSPEFVKALSDQLLLPPVRREVLATPPVEPFMQLFYNSAIVSRTWYDPDSESTDAVFAKMVQDVTSGSLQVNEAVNSADASLDTLLEPYVIRTQVQ